MTTEALFSKGLRKVHLSEVVRIRRLVMTNRDYPEPSYEQTVPNWSSLGNDEICRELVLVCRWKWMTNRDDPELSYEQTVPNWSSLGNDEICRELVLVCRWKWITYYDVQTTTYRCPGRSERSRCRR